MHILPLFFLIPTLLHAASLRLSIPPSPPVLANPSTLPPSTHASLTAPSVVLTAPISRTNSFTFHNLSANSYLCEIYSRDFVFAPLRVDVNQKGEVDVWFTFRGNEWDNKGEKIGGREQEGERVVDVRVMGEKGFYEKRGGFSLLSLLKSPMILIGVVGLGLVVGMPYLLDNMDPEMKAEFEAQQKKSPLAAGAAGGNPLQGFDVAGWMAGTTAKSSGADEASSEGAGKARKRG